MPAKNRTPKDAVNPRPLHERIATDLRRAIMDGNLKPGDSLPSTEQLKTHFTASNASVQKAVSMLKAEGLVEGRSGKAVIALENRRQTMTPAAYSKPAEPGKPYRWLTEAEKNGLRPTIQIIDVAEVRPPPAVAAAFGVEESSAVVLRKRLLSLDGEPCELVHSYYPIDLARGTALAGRAKIKGGSPSLLAELGYPPLHTVDHVTAEEATNEEYEALRLPLQIAVLRTFRVIHSRDDKVIEVTTMAKAGHLYALRYDF